MASHAGADRAASRYFQHKRSCNGQCSVSNIFTSTGGKGRTLLLPGSAASYMALVDPSAQKKGHGSNAMREGCGVTMSRTMSMALLWAMCFVAGCATDNAPSPAIVTTSTSAPAITNNAPITADGGRLRQKSRASPTRGHRLRHGSRQSARDAARKSRPYCAGGDVGLRPARATAKKCGRAGARA